MKDPTVKKIILNFLFWIMACVFCVFQAANNQSFLWGGFGVCAAFFVGWKTRHDLFLIEFKEMLDLVKKVGDYYEKESRK